ncbi:unnamed protein product, partial [Mesorhabditis belari]|uniref:Uncharacterized protein n=1 Tax=Mesorhabditis belari TaxID=2138241 RepID=A0AAF3F3C2_9BILA
MCERLGDRVICRYCNEANYSVKSNKMYDNIWTHFLMKHCDVLMAFCREGKFRYGEIVEEENSQHSLSVDPTYEDNFLKYLEKNEKPKYLLKENFASTSQEEFFDLDDKSQIPMLDLSEPSRQSEADADDEMKYEIEENNAEKKKIGKRDGNDSDDDYYPKNMIPKGKRSFEICEICGKKLLHGEYMSSTKFMLIEHVKTHMDWKEYKCSKDCPQHSTRSTVKRKASPTSAIAAKKTDDSKSSETLGSLMELLRKKDEELKEKEETLERVYTMMGKKQTELELLKEEMGFLKSTIILLVLGMTMAQANVGDGNEGANVKAGWQRNAGRPYKPSKSRYWREMQLRILNSSWIFPRKDIINQRYALVLKPMIITHVLETPSFNDFLKYYTHGLDEKSKLYGNTEANVKSALSTTFDLLVKQYGKLDADMNLWNEIQNAKAKREANELDFFLSDEFTEILLKNTAKYLDGLKENNTNKVVKRAIEILESEFNEAKGVDKTDDGAFMESILKSIRHNREADAIDYDQLSFIQKLSLLVEDDLLNPFLDSVNYEMERAKRAYTNEGIGAALKAIFSAPVSVEERENERREAKGFGSKAATKTKHEEIVERDRHSILEKLTDPLINEVNYKTDRVKKAYEADGIKGVLKSAISAPISWGFLEKRENTEAEAEVRPSRGIRLREVPLDKN